MAANFFALVGAVALPLAGGFVGSLVTIPEIKGWYSRLKKPRWTPPNWLFGPAWSVLYTAQGVASWLVWRRRGAKNVATPLILYGIQLALNFAWTPIFFKLHRPDAATVEATAVLGVATAATITMSKAAGSAKILPLMVPYLGWMAFATALSAAIAIKNPEAHKLDGGPSKDQASSKAKETKAPPAPTPAPAAAASASATPVVVKKTA